jgi:uncharacterized membrane protein YfcA
MTSFDVLLIAVTIIAGALASVSGFGVGSLLRPLLAVQAGPKAAVAAVAIPHVVASGVRFWQLRHHVDWKVVKSFGITSAAGGLVGALLYSSVQNAVVTAIFAAHLIFAGAAGATGLAQRMRFRGVGAWVAGAVSGIFGGLVGNQGGIRSTAMVGFNIKRDAFVATAIALIVDGARLPAYLITDWSKIAQLRPQIIFMTIGVVTGTLVGR